MAKLEPQRQAGRLHSNSSRISFESSVSRYVGYRPDVDGLRAIAVLAVVFYHLGVAHLRGGFAGVDIFYVISGYLITSVLARDLNDGRFSLISFYERRIRRIFPALFFVLFVSIAAAAIFFGPREMTDFGATLVSTTFFVSNLYFWSNARPLGYFDSAVSFQPLLHTWSLSVEEQFYVVFPLTLFVLFRWARAKINAWLIVLTGVSFGLNIWATHYQPILAFYFFLPRAWELLAGSLLGVKAVPPIRNRILRELAGFLGLGMLVCALWLPIMSNAPFPGYIVLLPCFGAWLVIYSGEAGPSAVRTILSFRPLVFIGVISYSLYLWHWPIIVFTKHLPFCLYGREETLVVFVSSVVLSFLSFEFIERPFRGSGSSFSRRQIFALGFAVSAVTTAFGSAAYLSHGLWQRYDPHSRQLIAENLQRVDDYDSSCANWKTDVHELTDIHFCSLGNQVPHKIMFWGDSHVEQLYPAIGHLYNQHDLGDRGAVFAIENACLPDEHLNNVQPGFHCDSFARLAMQRAEQPDIDTVFLGFSTWWAFWDGDFCLPSQGECGPPLSHDNLRRRFLFDLSEEIRTLQSHGKHVIVSLPFPVYDEKIPDLEIDNVMLGRFGMARSAKETSLPSLREEVRALAISSGTEVFDPRKDLCPEQVCLTENGGVSLYRDESHLTRSGVTLLENNLRAVLQHHSGQQSSEIDQRSSWSHRPRE